MKRAISFNFIIFYTLFSAGCNSFSYKSPDSIYVKEAGNIISDEVSSVINEAEKCKSTSCSIDTLKPFAEKGNAEAQFHLGVYYIKRGVGDDDGIGVYWLQKAVDQGNAKAINAMGFIHKAGIFVSADMKEAIRYFIPAAGAGGFHAAEFEVGKYYAAQNNYPSAIMLLTRASDSGLAEASYELGKIRQKQHNHPRDLKEAYRLFNKAVDDGYAPARRSLLELDYVKHCLDDSATTLFSVQLVCEDRDKLLNGIRQVISDTGGNYRTAKTNNGAMINNIYKENFRYNLLGKAFEYANFEFNSDNSFIKGEFYSAQKKNINDYIEVENKLYHMFGSPHKSLISRHSYWDLNDGIFMYLRFDRDKYDDPGKIRFTLINRNNKDGKKYFNELSREIK